MIDDGLKDGLNRVFIQLIFFFSDMDIVTAAFGDIERAIRETDEVFDGETMLGVQRGADAHVERDPASLPDQDDGPANAVARRQDAITGGSGEHDENLISAPSNNQVCSTRGFQDGFPDFLKHFVPGLMPLGIVQSLEVIEIA
jgi:hypothetical protein